MEYATLKVIHQGAVALSFLGFFARGCGMLLDARWIKQRPAKTLPHIVDTILLVSAIALAYRLRLSPLNAPWLTAKVAGLLIYIGLGMIAFRAGSRGVKIAAWIAALLMFGYIVSVAMTKSPLGALARAL
jgi:uncharacterized membrane protein SirB2